MENENEIFVGRERYVEEFTEWLTNRRDSDAPWILSVYDAQTDPSKQGGVGKTWLLHKFSEIAKQTFQNTIIGHIDFFNIADRDGIDIAQNVVSALKNVYPKWNTSNTEKILKEYSTYKGAEFTEVRSMLVDAIIADFHTLGDRLNKDNQNLLIFFDTFEFIEENPLIAVLRPGYPFPDSYGFSNIAFVIAGRNKINFNHSNWHSREREVESMPISPFTQSETREYFEKLSKLSMSHLADDAMQALYSRTEGRPILIGLVNDVLNQRKMTLKELISVPRTEFEASLVGEISELGRTIDTIILFMAHAYHRFNFSLLDWILRESDFSDLLQDVDPDKLSQQLLHLSFVRRPSSGDDFVLHDEMRPLVNRYGWSRNDPDRRYRTSLSQSVAKYYKHKLQNTQSEQLKQTYTVELLFHKLYVDLENGYEYFSENFSRAVNLRLNPFSRSLLREVKQFSKQMSPTQLNDLKFAEARLLQKEEEAARALHLLVELEQEADKNWLSEHRSDVFFEKGVAYQQLNQYSNAIESFNASMGTEKERGNMSDYAYLLNWVGFVHEKQGHLDTALHYYEEGLDIHKRLHNKRACATALLNISNVYQLQGKVEDALRRAKTSWHIRNELFKQGEMSEVYVGWSLCSIGTVYYQINDFSSANNFFLDALDIFTRTGHKRGLATVYNRQGKLLMDQGELPYARQWFERARSTSLNIDTGSYINSLNKLGWIATLEEQYQNAINLLQNAIDLAKKAHDDYQQAESLADLAIVFKRFGDNQQSQEAQQEARKICLQYHYHYLLGLSYSSEGDVFYEAQNYKEAFINYGEACYYMMQYNQLEYNKELRKLVDHLLETPPDEINPIVDKLVAYWSSQGLDKSYPDFISSNEEVRGLLGV